MDDNVVLDSRLAIERYLNCHVPADDLIGRGLRIVLCDARNRVLVHLPIHDVPLDLTEDECADALGPFAKLLGHGHDGAVLVALTRAGPPMVTTADGRWFRAATDVCDRYAVRFLGLHLVTSRGQREVVLDDAL
jgi:hypothetical protein